jgi:nucleoside-diphosphate-sugar epimerase
MARDPRRYGAYAWGKTLAEQVVRDEAPGVGVEACIIRPAALIDYDAIDFPGLLGRRLVGGLHLGLGRPSLPLAVLDVSEAGDAIAWCAQHFDEAPRVVNLFEGSLRTRRDTLTEFRRRGWRGRVLWVPVSAMAGLVMGLKTAMALARRQEPEPLAAWSVLRPRWFDPTASRRVLEGARQPVVQREAHQRQELVPGAG